MIFVAVLAAGVLLDIVHSPQPPPAEPPLLTVKECLINIRQHEGFIKLLMVENLFPSLPLILFLLSFSSLPLSSCSSLALSVWLPFLLSFVSQCFQQDIVRCADHVEQLETEFVTRMQQLKDVVQAKTAVPTAQVYVSTTSWD